MENNNEVNKFNQKNLQLNYDEMFEKSYKREKE